MLQYQYMGQIKENDMVAKQEFNSLIELVEYFDTEEKCREHLKQIRWKDGKYCPYCGSIKVYEFSNGVTYKCGDCRNKFSIKVGTIFEDSKIPLRKWFMAIYLLTAHKKGISSLQLHRDIKVTQKTAWFMLHRIRHATKTKAFNQPLKNTVEVDETYIGGKERNKHRNKRVKGTQGRNTKTKNVVLGMVERNGNIKAFKIDDATQKTILSKVTEHVVIGTELMTDEYVSYKGLEWLYKHQYIKHKNGEYVNGSVHTNTAEGFFSQFKRGVLGIYHFVSPEHLDRYLTEFTFRYNTRDYSEDKRFDLLLSNCAGRIDYRTLIGTA